MQNIAHALERMLLILSVLSVIAYAPFARTWARASLAIFLFASAYSIVRIWTVMTYNEHTGPLIAVAIEPLMFVLYGGILRCIKIMASKFAAYVNLRLQRKSN